MSSCGDFIYYHLPKSFRGPLLGTAMQCFHMGVINLALTTNIHFVFGMYSEIMLEACTCVQVSISF